MEDCQKCPTCGKKAHNYEKEEALSCVPPIDVLIFGKYHIDKEYREALYAQYPFYTSEEVVGSFLGYNPDFPSEEEWFEERKEEISDDDDESED